MSSLKGSGKVQPLGQETWCGPGIMHKCGRPLATPEFRGALLQGPSPKCQIIFPVFLPPHSGFKAWGKRVQWDPWAFLDF